MKLRIPPETLEDQLLEFDVWVTPELLDISKTKKYKTEMAHIRDALDLVKDIGQALSSAASRKLPIGEAVSTAYTNLLLTELKPIANPEHALRIAQEKLLGLASTLFLVTGKSDNNNKCQFPLHLQRTLEWQSLPYANKTKNKGVVSFEIIDQEVPRELKAKDYMGIVAGLLVSGSQYDLFDSNQHIKHGMNLLAQFIGFILSDDENKAQFLTIVSIYHQLKAQNQDPETFLAPMVRFKVKGSVSATGGHKPEEILRQRLAEWGLKRDRDFNIADVVLDIEAGRIHEKTKEESKAVKKALPPKEKDKKTRAYDFVLPFRTKGWTSRLFIQSQYYAGDSGSVSHKVVDQTTASRNNARQLLKKILGDRIQPRFIEYVDGAGYFSSLNGDLKNMLQMHDTKSFFQVKSSPIRLRRELQDIGYLTPLEIEHALLLLQNETAVQRHLIDEGYSKEEVARALNDAKARGLIKTTEHGISISRERQELARKYMLLDLIAIKGDTFGNATGLQGVVLVPGFGPYYGIKLSELGQILSDVAPNVWTTPAEFCSDLAWLSEQGFIIQR